MKPSKQLILGFPKSGKTTFLAALWHLLQSNEVETSLVLKGLFGDDEYVNRISSKWLQYEDIGRTVSQSNENIVTIQLVDPDSEKELEVLFSDLDGETFVRQWEDRCCSNEFYGFASSASGVLLFLHLDCKYQEALIAGHQGTVAALQQTASEEDEDEEIIEWEHKHSARQSAIVDVVQFVNKMRQDCENSRIAVVVSAWDKRISEEITPRQWLKDEVPFLFQFLTANGHRTPFEVFGVSCQGFDLKDADDHAENVVTPSKRICIQRGAEDLTHDLTAILKWVME